VTFEVHAIVEHPPDLHLMVITGPVQEEMAGPMNSPDGFPDPVWAVPKVVGPHGGRDLGTGVTAHTPGGLGHVHDCLGQQGFVPAASLFPELFVRPFEDRLDVLLGLRG